MSQSLYRYKKRMLILCIMLAVVLMITGVSYAVFTSYSSQTDANTLAASCMDLEFNGQNEINLLNTYPISEGEALEQTPYTFTIKNKCDNYIEYYVIASVISTTNKVDSKYVKVSLLGDNDLNGTVINTLESISTPQSLSKYNITENYILKRGDGISKDESRTFNFRMWLDSSNKDIWTKEDIEGKDYQVKISVVGTVKTRPKDDLYVAALIDGVESSTFPTTNKYTASVECTRNGKKIDAKESIEWSGTEWELTTKIKSGNVRCNATFESLAPAPNGWYEAGNGTLLASLRDNNTLKTPITTPGAAVSTADEALLASAVDDYGTSYYFRGAVTNNYVKFANKCWRIVRVSGDGSVKLILHNDNTTKVANPCDAANNSASAAFARYSGEKYTSKFNTNYDDNAYVGFKYGTVGASDYASAHANINNSTILTNLETWYTNNLKTYADTIADTVWCNDKTNVTDTSYDPWGWTPNGYGYGKNVTYYGATQRLISTNGRTGGTGPSLKCNSGLSKINSKVGLITADELAYAGYAAALKNTTTYLQENATDTDWLSLSPSVFFSVYAFVWSVNGGSGDFGNYSVNSDGGVRPAISLIISTTISGGTGTSEDPYVVN
ncbi:MAG: hypothetical protein DBY43_00925 [Clostridiaceae bacterium]|nr:MAG: hypothetical protein DBY43_00925 [Clostridiaceae bacterium]